MGTTADLSREIEEEKKVKEKKTKKAKKPKDIKKDLPESIVAKDETNDNPTQILKVERDLPDKLQFAGSIKVINKSDNPPPEYQTSGAAGFDIHANEQVRIHAGKSAPVRTGLYFEIENGMEVQIRPRSGLAAKKQITVLNSPGTIDSDYRGEIIVMLINHNPSKTFIIEKGDRIAQGILSPVYRAKFVLQDELTETDRGEGGFGSTG